ncbi:MAG: hypothetical protein HY701_06345 [Gemmatimonadetes bacterium]|nr:hypothetical protein [Gemmatimonadota bacterium]
MGTPMLLAWPDSQRKHVQYNDPHVLPGGRAALITLAKGVFAFENLELGIVRIPDGEVAEPGIAGNNPRYVPTGHIVFDRDGASVFAAPFSLRRLQTTGAAVACPVCRRVRGRGEGA